MTQLANVWVIALVFVFGHHLSSGAPGSPNCHDKLGNCATYGPGVCTQFQDWARLNCNLTCKFCTAPEPACEDKLVDCVSYDLNICTDTNYRSWAEQNCRYRCRLCSPRLLALKDSLTTTVPPNLCVDKVDCRLYTKSACTGKNEGWARTNCMNFCGFCRGIATPPQICANTIPDCTQYDRNNCNDARYTIWAIDKCPKYCGKCGGPGIIVPQTPHPTPAIPTRSPFIGK